MPDSSRKLRSLIAGSSPLIAPGAYDAISALIIQQIGFDVVYVTGGGVARSMGYPDVGLVTFNEMLTHIEEIARICQIPIIADADTGYGTALNVMRTVRAYEQAGVAGLHLEDQVFPKRCGHYEGQTLISVEEMVGKIEAACQARRDPDFFIIARTDARAVGSIDDCIARARAYIAAGADGIFVEAPRSLDEIRALAQAIKAVLVYNMTDSGKSPMIPVKTLGEMGFQIVLFPSQAQRAAMLAMQRVLSQIKTTGQLPEPDQMIDFKTRDKIINHAQYIEWEARYVR